MLSHFQGEEMEHNHKISSIFLGGKITVRKREIWGKLSTT